MPIKRLATFGFQKLWRATRGLTLYAEACLIDGEGRIVVADDGKGKGLVLPGRVVENGETASSAILQALASDFGVAAAGPPRLVSMQHYPSVAAAAAVSAMFDIADWSIDSRWQGGHGPSRCQLLAQDKADAAIRAKIARALQTRPRSN